jgi:tetratricopeptide (TPR) repeat protein
MCCLRQNNFWVIIKTEILKGKFAMRKILTICNYLFFGLLFVALTSCSNTSTIIADKIGKNIKSLKAKAEKGNAKAQFELGLCYADGYGVKKDDAEAVKWFRRAAEQGFAMAQYGLGLCYYNGEGVKEDKAEAVKWFRKAAKQGDAMAQYSLGLCYHNGEGVKEDKAEAVKWLRKAAEQGHAKAKEILQQIENEKSR